MGIAVQLAALQILLKLGVNYLLATALAVEAALLHNYVWHCFWTWSRQGHTAVRLLRFHLSNGLVSVISNLLWMRLLTGWLGMPPMAANLVAISATAVLNFALADRWVFANQSAVLFEKG
jgi:putative flippase GtrA